MRAPWCNYRRRFGSILLPARSATLNGHLVHTIKGALRHNYFPHRMVNKNSTLEQASEFQPLRGPLHLSFTSTRQCGLSPTGPLPQWASLNSQLA